MHHAYVLRIDTLRINSGPGAWNAQHITPSIRGIGVVCKETRPINAQWSGQTIRSNVPVLPKMLVNFFFSGFILTG